MATPLTLDRALDVASLERLVERLIAGGVHGLFVLGTTGEGPSLGNTVRREVVQRVCRQVAGRTPVLVGVTDTALAESIDLAGFAADSGAQATVLAPPCYFPIDQEDLFRCAEQLVGNSPLPLFLYNMPALTKTWYEPATVRRLLELPAIVGVKDSSGDLDYFSKMSALVSQRPECSLLIGPEHLLGASIGLGGRGGVCGGANIFPELFVALYEAAVSGESFTQYEELVVQLGEIYRLGTNPVPAVIQGVKAALESQGFGSAELAEPFSALPQSDRLLVQTIVQTVELHLATLLPNHLVTKRTSSR